MDLLNKAKEVASSVQGGEKPAAGEYKGGIGDTVRLQFHHARNYAAKILTSLSRWFLTRSIVLQEYSGFIYVASGPHLSSALQQLQGIPGTCPCLCHIG